MNKLKNLIKIQKTTIPYSVARTSVNKSNTTITATTKNETATKRRH